MPIPHPPHFLNAVAEVQADPEGFALMRWQPGPRPLVNFQEAMNALLCVIRALGSGKALVDTRQMDAHSAEEQHWVITNWLPRAVVQGNYRYAAILSPPEAMAWLMRVEPHLLDWPQAPTYVRFDDEAAARQWLRAQIVVGSHI